MATNIAGQTLAQIPSQANSQFAVGGDTFDATAIVAADSVVVTCGFRPKYIVWENVTDRVKGEWYEGMANNSCIKTAANGTRTLEVTGGNGGITPTQSGFSVSQNATLALILASKVCVWKTQA